MSVCPVTGRPVPGAPELRSMLDPDRVFDLWDLTDSGLVRLRRQHHFAAGTIARDILAGEIDERAGLPRMHGEWGRMLGVRHHQLLRFRLRMRYGAVDDHVGTSSYDCYMRHDERPSYALALHMDGTRARLGRRHVLDWQTEADKIEARRSQTPAPSGVRS